MTRRRQPPIFGPEPWDQQVGRSWCHWDLATYSRSKPAPCRTPNAAHASANSAPNSSASRTTAPNWPNCSTARNRRADRRAAHSGAQHIRDVIENGEDKYRKHLLQAVIAEIRVESREHITLVYRVPHAQQVDTVRAPQTKWAWPHTM